ncbi:hypothetical protein GCM10023321_46480 [Pseudonocardia eucalypti]|uniref:Glyoxalase n=1 Tax=Pseudonocardia eucalypti TaxID=648755 RepID=A0ABP9QGX8_9PSEU|nr:catechol 2,3-dioxygenase-like lactoylglutathione lyase family enzyme [Pseudonocardia eucalypti]
MVEGIETVIHPVRDLARAKTLYRAFTGMEPVKDEPYYVGFETDSGRLGLDPNGHRAEHAVGHRAQVAAVGLEPLGQRVILVHAHPLSRDYSIAMTASGAPM